MKSHESSYTEELRSIISTTHPLQQSKAVAVSNGGLTMEREVHEGMWKLPRYERNLHIYSITVKGKLLFIMVVSLKYIFIWRILGINFPYMSVVTWYLGGGGFVLVCWDCCAAVGRLSLAWTAWKLGDLPKHSLLNAGTAVKSLWTRL